MRKILLVMLALVLSFAFIGCGGSDDAVLGVNIPAPEFNGDNADPAIINASNSQAIVDAAMSIGYVYMGVDEAMSPLDYMNSILNVVDAGSIQNGIINGCDGSVGGDDTGGSGLITVTKLMEHAGGGGEMTMEFDSFVVYEPYAGDETTCHASAVITSGFMNVSVYESATAESGTISMYGVNIQKAGSNLTFDGTIVFSESWNNTTFDASGSVASSVKMTDESGSAGTNETMFVNYTENWSWDESANTETQTFGGTLYTPADGIVWVSTTTPVLDVSGTIEEGKVRLSTSTSGNYIDLLMDLEEWSGFVAPNTYPGGFFTIIQGY